MTDETTADIAAIKARVEAATEGPWDFWHADDGRLEMYVPNGTMSTETVLEFRDYDDCPECCRLNPADAEFVAHARTDVPALLAEVERLAAELERTKRGARTLGHIIEQNGRMILDITGLHDWIDEDGDGDWGAVWDNAYELRPRIEKAEAERDAALANAAAWKAAAVWRGATEAHVIGGGWVDKHGDVWREGDDGLLHTPETRPFSREHVERKWGPLRPAREVTQ